MRRARRPPLIRVSYFLWLIVLALLWWAATTLGEPYVIWSFSWQKNGRPYGDTASRTYTSCTYLGLRHGVTVTEAAEDGKCGWLRFPHRGWQ